MDTSTLRTISDVGVAVAGIVALSLFSFWLIRSYIETLKSDRDHWRSIASGAVAAIDRLADELASKRRGS